MYFQDYIHSDICNSFKVSSLSKNREKNIPLSDISVGMLTNEKPRTVSACWIFSLIFLSYMNIKYGLL